MCQPAVLAPCVPSTLSSYPILFILHFPLSPSPFSTLLSSCPGPGAMCFCPRADSRGPTVWGPIQQGPICLKPQSLSASWPHDNLSLSTSISHSATKAKNTVLKRCHNLCFYLTVLFFMMFSKTKRLLSPTPFLERPALFQRHSDSASAFTTSPYAGAQCDDTAYFTYFTPGILELSLFTQVFFFAYPHICL